MRAQSGHLLSRSSDGLVDGTVDSASITRTISSHNRLRVGRRSLGGFAAGVRSLQGRDRGARRESLASTVPMLTGSISACMSIVSVVGAGHQPDDVEFGVLVPTK